MTAYQAEKNRMFARRCDDGDVVEKHCGKSVDIVDKLSNKWEIRPSQGGKIVDKSVHSADWDQIRPANGRFLMQKEGGRLCRVKDLVPWGRARQRKDWAALSSMEKHDLHEYAVVLGAWIA